MDMQGCGVFVRWEVIEAAAGAPITHGATLPTGMTGPQVTNMSYSRLVPADWYHIRGLLC